MQEAAERLRARLNELSPAVMRGFIEAQTGPFDAVDLLLQDPALFDWIRFKTTCIEHYVGAFYRGVKEIDPKLKLACGPRISAFAPLTGYNYRRLGEVTDFIAPKLYFWQHGIDGLKGTVFRYAKTLVELNEGVDEGLALDFVFKLFGFTMPGVRTLDELSAPLNEAFFRETVPGEIAKMIFPHWSGGAPQTLGRPASRRGADLVQRTRIALAGHCRQRPAKPHILALFGHE